MNDIKASLRRRKLQMCQLLSIAENPFSIPGFSFILHCCIVLDYNHLGAEEVAFTSCFKVSVGFEASAPKGLTRGWRLNPAISSPYIVRQLDHKVRADCLSGAGLGVAHPASTQWAERRMESASSCSTFSCVNSCCYLFYMSSELRLNMEIHERFKPSPHASTHISHNLDVEILKFSLLNIKQRCIKPPAACVLQQAYTGASRCLVDAFAACHWPCFWDCPVKGI